MAKQRDSKSSRQSVRRGKASRFPTRELARTWLITVINPVLQGLRRERVWLTRRNWSWRYSTGTFEHLWLVEYYVDPLYRDNFAEFLAWYPSVGVVARDHDAALKELAAACNEAFRRLWETGDFAAAVLEADAIAAQKGASIDHARGALPVEDWRRLIAEYLINNVQTLPEHYTAASYWREAGTVILRVRNVAPLRAEFEKLDRLGEKALQAAQEAERRLVAVRQDYTRKFGLPPVPLPTTTEVSGT